MSSCRRLPSLRFRTPEWTPWRPLPRNPAVAWWCERTPTRASVHVAPFQPPFFALRGGLSPLTPSSSLFYSSTSPTMGEGRSDFEPSKAAEAGGELRIVSLAMQGKLDEAMQLCERLCEAHQPLQQSTFCSLIDACAEGQRLDRCFQVFIWMQTNNYEPGGLVMDALLRACIQNEEMTPVRYILEAMRNNPAVLVPPSSHLIKELIRVSSETEPLEATAELIKALVPWLADKTHDHDIKALLLPFLKKCINGGKQMGHGRMRPKRLDLVHDVAEAVLQVTSPEERNHVMSRLLLDSYASANEPAKGLLFLRKELAARPSLLLSTSYGDEALENARGAVVEEIDMVNLARVANTTKNRRLLFQTLVMFCRYWPEKRVRPSKATFGELLRSSLKAGRGDSLALLNMMHQMELGSPLVQRKHFLLTFGAWRTRSIQEALNAIAVLMSGSSNIYHRSSNYNYYEECANEDEHEREEHDNDSNERNQKEDKAIQQKLGYDWLEVRIAPGADVFDFLLYSCYKYKRSFNEEALKIWQLMQKLNICDYVENCLRHTLGWAFSQPGSDPEIAKQLFLIATELGASLVLRNYTRLLSIAFRYHQRAPSLSSSSAAAAASSSASSSSSSSSASSSASVHRSIHHPLTTLRHGHFLHLHMKQHLPTAANAPLFMSMLLSSTVPHSEDAALLNSEQQNHCGRICMNMFLNIRAGNDPFSGPVSALLSRPFPHNQQIRLEGAMEVDRWKSSAFLPDTDRKQNLPRFRSALRPNARPSHLQQQPEEDFAARKQRLAAMGIGEGVYFATHEALRRAGLEVDAKMVRNEAKVLGLWRPPNAKQLQQQAVADSSFSFIPKAPGWTNPEDDIPLPLWDASDS
ncbi:hypothetical protein QOT17_023076 [Balamuthia mandrillaris]